MRMAEQQQIEFAPTFYQPKIVSEIQNRANLELLQIFQKLMEGAHAVGRQKKKQLKKTIMNEINALKPKPDATPEEAIESLVKQAEFYTNFLISGYDTKKSTHTKNEKRRGHFDEEQEEERQLLQQQQQQNEELFTRLTEQPSNLKGGKLKHYQLIGLNWMISLYESGLNGILADDMGLGKTIQTISILAFLRQFKKVKGPHIIIAPKITLGNWKNEFDKWLPDCKVVKLIATKQERTQILANSVVTQKFDVLITSFQGVRICLNNLKNIKWHYIVIDEAHKIKNEQSQLSQLVRKLSNECKLLLTGTPLQNNLHQLWSLLNFLLPEIFDSSEMFDNWFNSKKASTEEGEDALNQEQIEKKNVHMIQQLHKILKPFMLRRTKAEVQKSLPGKKEVHIFVGLTDAQLKVYKSLLQNKSASEQDKKVYLNLLMQLRKVCNHPYLFEGVEAPDAPSLGEHLIENCGKLIVLDKLLKKLFAEGGHQVLIFSQMTMVLDILEDYCNYREFKYCRIDGSTDMTSRDEQIEQFMNPKTDKFVFLLSTRAGGLGINLTSADTVIIYDSDWNPQMDLQAMDRAHRIGQKNLVNVYRLITENTIEQKIIQRQLVKLKWDNLVIQQAKASSQKNKSLSKEEIKQMLQYGASLTLKAEKGTYTDEEIDKVLERGENKTNELNKALDERIKKPENLTDFSMNSINIFDFMMNDDKQRKQDQQALDEAMARMLQGDIQIRTRRQKLKNVNYQFDSSKKEAIKAQRKINLPQFHFYSNRDKLLQLLEKEEEYQIFRNSDPSREPLTEEEQELKLDLLDSGFRTWLKSDFNNFVSASEKYGRNSIAEIANFVGKSVKQIKQYHTRFWERINQLPEKDKILKQIQAGEQKIANKKHNSQLLSWKAQKCYEIDFNPQIYTKFKSKLFTIDADRFLAQSAYKYGLKNMNVIRDQIRAESMFRFDFHFRSRTESQLNKRLQSLYKLIEKEKDIVDFGFDNDMLKETKKKYKKKKEGDKKNEDDLIEQQQINSSGSDQEMELNNKPRKISAKERQTLITNFRRHPETIQIDANQEEMDD